MPDTYALVVVTPPVQEPVSVIEMRTHCRIDHEEDDGLLGGWIAAARGIAEAVTGRALITQTLRLSLPDWPQGDRGHRAYRWSIRLPRPRAQSVVSIQYVHSSTGMLTTLPPSQYTLAADYEPAIIDPAYGATWAVPRRQRDAVRVTYVAGYGDDSTSVPEQIRSAMRMLVAHWYEHREAIGEKDVARLPLPMGVEYLLMSCWCGVY